MTNKKTIRNYVAGWDNGDSDFPTFRAKQRAQEAVAQDPAIDSIQFYQGYCDGFKFAQGQEDAQSAGLTR